jgi:hypothetical protein
VGGWRCGVVRTRRRFFSLFAAGLDARRVGIGRVTGKRGRVKGRTTTFFQEDLYPVSWASSGSLMSTSTKPRSRWSFTSETGIFVTAAWVATDPRVARVSLVARLRTTRGATAVLKVTEEALMAAMVSRSCVKELSAQQMCVRTAGNHSAPREAQIKS